MGEALRAYETGSPTGLRTRAELPIEAVADLADEGLWSLRALYGGTAPGTKPVQKAAHVANLRGLLRCLGPVTETAKRG
jgi:hypothetical protein